MGGARKLCGVSFKGTPILFMRGSLSWPKNLPKAPLSDIITLGFRFQLISFGEHKHLMYGRPGWYSGKESVCQCRRYKRHKFDFQVRKLPWSRKWQPIPAFLPGKFHGQRSLVGYSPWGHKESDTTERLRHTHTVAIKSVLWMTILAPGSIKYDKRLHPGRNEPSYCGSWPGFPCFHHQTLGCLNQSPPHLSIWNSTWRGTLTKIDWINCTQTVVWEPYIFYNVVNLNIIMCKL